DSCSSGTCTTHTGDPCPGADGDGDCQESCDESGDNCTANDPDGSACTDALFCNGTDTCSSGACTTHAGDPCPGPAGAFEPSGTVCNAGSGDLCDPDEVCDGATAPCPSDTVAAGGTVCNPGS